MDRSSFLKKLAAGAVLPSMLAGCDTNETGESNILDPGDDEGALKASSTDEIQSEDWDIVMYRFSFDKYLLNKIGRVGDMSIYQGVESYHSREGDRIVAYYDEIQQTLLLTTISNNNSVFSFLGNMHTFYPPDSRRFFYGPWHLYYRGTPMDMDLCLYLEKGVFPGMYDGVAKPAIQNVPSMELPDIRDLPPFLKDIE